MQKSSLEIVSIDPRHLDDITQICFQSFQDTLGNSLYFKEFEKPGPLKEFIGMLLDDPTPNIHTRC